MTAKSQLKDIKHSCRICLSFDSELHSIMNDSRELCHIISFAVGEKFELNDDLPKSICTDCKLKANMAFEFKKKYQETDSILQELLKISEIKIEKLDFNNDTDYTIQNGGFSDNEEKPDFKEELENYSATEDHEDCVKQGIYCPLCGLFCENTKHLNDHIPKIHKELIHSTSRNKSLIHGYKLDIKVPEVKHKILIPKKRKKDVDNNVGYKLSGSYCPLCGDSFETSMILTEHMWKNHNNLMCQPKNSRSGFSDLFDSREIKITKHKPTKISCAICKMKIIKKKRRQHYITHKNTKIHKCTLCNKMFLQLIQFEKHKCMNKIQQRENNLTSDLCNENLTNINPHGTAVETELSEENITDPYICQRCGVICVSDIELRSHFKEEHLTCQQCFKVFSTSKILNQHFRICKGVKIKQEHEISEIKPYQCNECEEVFNSKKDIVLHLVRHKPKIFECDVCKKVFNRKDNLKSHKRVHDPNKKPMKSPKTVLCGYCGLNIAINNLTIHMRRHSGVKPFKCNICEKCFITSSDMKRHSRIHSGEKPHDCKLCGRKFARNSQLILHMRVHTGHKPYKCTYCDRAFTQSNDCKSHIRSHTGEKPYICDVCGEGFIRGSSLKNHRLKSGHILVMDKTS